MISIDKRSEILDSRRMYISCILPIFNEKENLIPLTQELELILSKHSENYEIILVDDGSTDGTKALVLEMKRDKIKYLELSRRYGKESALFAGLAHAKGEIIVMLDADFQHPPHLISDFINKWREGYDMVYGLRQNRDNDSIIRRNFTRLFYGIMKKLTNVPLSPNAGDFRLMDRKVVNALLACHEKGLFLKGLYSWIGFKSLGIPFHSPHRKKGKSGWKYIDLTELALTGIASFSNIPLRIWSIIGFCISLIALGYASFITLKTLVYGADVPGFATIVVAILFLGGIQLLSIGILGEYIARIFHEVKNRPRFLISDKIGFDD